MRRKQWISVGKNHAGLLGVKALSRAVAVAIVDRVDLTGLFNSGSARRLGTWSASV